MTRRGINPGYGHGARLVNGLWWAFLTDDVVLGQFATKERAEAELAAYRRDPEAWLRAVRAQDR